MEKYGNVSFWRERNRLSRPLSVVLTLAAILILWVIDSATRTPLSQIAQVMDRFPQVDRIVITTPEGEAYTLEEEAEVARYRDLLEPGILYSGSRREIQALVVEKVAEVTFYIGDEALVREELYLLQDQLDDVLRRAVLGTDRGPLIGKVGRDFCGVG